MKNILLSIGYCMMMTFTCIAQDNTPYWLNEKINEENRMPMHASYYVYESEALALKGAWKQLKNYLDLNGVQKFKYLESPSELPMGFERVSFDDTTWDNFKIPANWDVNGYGYPVYTHTTYDFANLITVNPPQVPTLYNPVGVYRRTMIIDKNWNDKEILLHVGAARSNLSVWVNGEYVG